MSSAAAKIRRPTVRSRCRLRGVTAILWEIGEYFAFIRNSSELATAYTDTLGDMALGLSGSALTATVAVLVLRRRSAAS
jgi:hypothetical protein